MRRTGKITHVGAPKEGVSKRGPWCFTPVTVKWNEVSRGVEDEINTLTMDVKGRVKQDKVNDCIRRELDVNFSFYFESREWKDTRITTITGYLPKDMMEDESQPSAF